MRYKSLALSAFSLLLLFTTFQLCSPVAFADDDTNADDDYAETARVARVTLVAGDVSLRRAGTDKWEHALPNVALVEGDRLATGAGARLEIQFDARNFLRVGEYATVDVVTLRNEGVALSLPEGTATLRLARFRPDHEYFEIDAPATTVAAEREGLYRLDVDKDGKVRVAVRDGGRARLYSQSSGFTLRDGRVAETVSSGDAQEPDWQFSALRPFDSWDTWVDERERYLLARLRYDDRERYYDSEVFGAEELDAYGDWVQTRDYGYVWRPRATVINNYYNWAPYRYGRWDWCEPYGWAWVGDEPWGWAPYHYGRWVYVDNYWCWAPRGYSGYRHRSWWRPALVVFVNLSFGDDHICWYPLPYRHRDPQSNFWRHLDRRRRGELSREEIARRKQLPPALQQAVSGIPARDFGRGNLRPQPVDAQNAKLALLTDPVRGRLPVRPVEGAAGGDERMRERLSESKRSAIASGGGGGVVTPNDPLRGIPERKTGAASRKPGVALDEQLRRERIFNNREPLVTKGAKGDSAKDPNGADPTRRAGDGNKLRAAGSDTGGRTAGDRPDTRPTGAVTRTPRPVRLPDLNNAGGGTTTDTRGRGDDKSGEANGGDPKRTIRPVRPTPELENRRPHDSTTADSPVRKVKPEERSEPPVEKHRESPPERHAEPAPHYERPAPRHEERPSPPPREERSTPREDRSSSREDRSSSRSESRSSESKSSSGSKSSSSPSKSESRHESSRKPPEEE
ncbi:MAG: DUF6600 domain-containing protein [Pyrinomonadaceae bacterium]